MACCSGRALLHKAGQPGAAMTAQLRLISGGIADRNTVAGIDHAMQALAHMRKTDPRPASERDHLRLVTDHVQAARPSKCACGKASCAAQTLWFDYMRLRAAWLLDQRQDYTPVALAYGAYRIAADACFARICPHLKRTDCDVVTVSSVDLDSGAIGDIRYLVRMVGSAVVVSPLAGQDITAEDAEHYKDAALGQWELERSL